MELGKVRLCICVAASLVLLTLPGCDSILDVEEPVDVIEDERLTSEDQVPFLISGVEARFATTHDVLTVNAGGLSDELFFDTDVENATFGSYRNLNLARIPLDQENDWATLGELRFFADDLLRRLEAIEFEDQSLKAEAVYKANLYGGIARYFYAVYFGLEPDRGGGVIDVGPFIPSDEMLQRGLEKLGAAYDVAEEDYQRRLVNTIRARFHLLLENYESAEAAAQDGLSEGDEPFQSRHVAQSVFGSDLPNEWYYSAGEGRAQFVVNFRYREYVEENAQETDRIPLEEIVGQATGTTYYYQNKYPETNSPIAFAKWQENELILAETKLRRGASDEAITHINRVRDSHGIDPVQSVDLDLLIEERDKELFAEGHRLYDQRRFGIFHDEVIAVTEASGAGEPLGPWRYLPIPDSERNANPNL